MVIILHFFILPRKCGRNMMHRRDSYEARRDFNRGGSDMVGRNTGEADCGCGAPRHDGYYHHQETMGGRGMSRERPMYHLDAATVVGDFDGDNQHRHSRRHHREVDREYINGRAASPTRNSIYGNTAAMGDFDGDTQHRHRNGRASSPTRMYQGL